MLLTRVIRLEFSQIINIFVNNNPQVVRLLVGSNFS